jgi:ligand-binding sensor domain-containing protein
MFEDCMVSTSTRRDRSRVSQLPQLILLFLIAVPSGFAQLRSLDVSQYLHTSWTVEGGFFPSGIGALIQTSDGYLWLASSSGLLRFDGIRFIEWQPPNNDFLPKQPLSSLLGSKDGSFWIGGQGLAEFRTDGGFRRYHELDGLAITALVEDRDGAIWAGGSSNPGGSPLCRVFREKTERYGGTVFTSNWVTTLNEDREGRLWASGPVDIWRLRPRPFRKIAHYDSMPRVFCEDAEGRLLKGFGNQDSHGRWENRRLSNTDRWKANQGVVDVER